MWDQRYAGDEYVYGTLPNEFLVSRVAALPRGRVLCLGEGEGRNAVWLAGRGHAVALSWHTRGSTDVPDVIPGQAHFGGFNAPRSPRLPRASLGLAGTCIRSSPTSAQVAQLRTPAVRNVGQP